MRILTPALLALLAACASEPDTDLPADPPGPCGAEGADTDGDGVCDADDACPGFDDAEDADGDGVPDACDPCPDDPDDDSDGDGVCDSDDQCPDFDDAIDEDGDGQPDACDACPVDPQDDRDSDGVCDSEDPCPDDAADDTDGDGVCDSWDVCPGVDDDLDADLDGTPDGCVCSVLDVPSPVGPANIPGGVGFGFAFEGIVHDGQFADYGDPGATSALFRVAVHDGTNFICSIWWDLTAPGVATPTAAEWTTRAPVALFEAWDLDLSGGQTDCSDPAAEKTLENYESLTLGFGIGPMHDLEASLRKDPAIDAAWDVDWEPWVTSMYLHVALDQAQPPLEVGYVLQYDRTCESLKRDPHTLERIQLPKPTSGPLLEFYEAVPLPVL